MSAIAKTTFTNSTYGKYKTFGTSVHDALIFVFRALFRVLDYVVTYSTFSTKLMADTNTPGARWLFNRNHFFVYSNEPLLETEKLTELKTQFYEAITKLDNLVSSSPSAGMPSNGYR